MKEKGGTALSCHKPPHDTAERPFLVACLKQSFQERGKKSQWRNEGWTSATEWSLFSTETEARSVPFIDMASEDRGALLGLVLIVLGFFHALISPFP